MMQNIHPQLHFSVREFLKKRLLRRQKKERCQRSRYPVWDERSSSIFWACPLDFSEKREKTLTLENRGWIFFGTLYSRESIRLKLFKFLNPKKCRRISVTFWLFCDFFKDVRYFLSDSPLAFRSRFPIKKWWRQDVVVNAAILISNLKQRPNTRNNLISFKNTIQLLYRCIKE